MGIMAGAAWAADGPPSPPEFRRLPPLPVVEQAANAAKIPLTGWREAAGRDVLRIGDAVIALVSVSEGQNLEQRILVLESAAPNAVMTKKQPGDRQARLYSSSGYEFVFGSERIEMEVTMVGPLKAADAGKKAATAPAVQRRRIGVAGDYLSLGLDRIPATALRVRAAKAADSSLPTGALNIAPAPFPAEKTGPARAVAEKVGITEADERALAGSVLSLVEFFQITAQTPGLQDVLKSVLDVPWWSILRSGGKMPQISFDALPGHRELVAGDWGLPADTKIYSYPLLLNLNDKPALLFQLAVVAPRPPLRVSAGIVGLAAGRPNGKGPVLTLQVVATRTAEEKTAP